MARRLSSRARQLNLLIWGKAWAKARRQALDQWWEMHVRGEIKEPDVLDYDLDNMDDYIRAKRAYEYKAKLILEDIPRYKAEQAAIRGTELLWEKLRRIVWERDKGRCIVCGRQCKPGEWECGHIIDRVVGGSDEPENLGVMCIVCNRLKPLHITREEFDEWVQRGAWMGEIVRRVIAELNEEETEPEGDR